MLLAYKRRIGWHFPWVSAPDSDFHHDFGVAFTEEEQRNGADYNYAFVKDLPAQREGMSVFGEQQVPGCVRRPTAVQAHPANARRCIGVREGRRRRLVAPGCTDPTSPAPLDAGRRAGASEHRRAGIGRARYVSGCAARNAGRREAPAAARSDRTSLSTETIKTSSWTRSR